MIKCYFDVIENETSLKNVIIKFDLSQTKLNKYYGNELIVNSSDIFYLNKYLNIISCITLSEISKQSDNQEIKFEFEKEKINYGKLKKINNHYELVIKNIPFYYFN